MIHHWKTRSVACVLVVAIILVSTGPQVLATDDSWDVRAGEEPSTPGMLFDLVFGRPFGIAATVLGTGLFLVSLPFSALGGNAGMAYKNLVVAPAKFTFKRPLGAGTQPDSP
jgi:hypothetical protein